MVPVKKKRALWTSEQLLLAMNAVNGGMSVNKASKEFNIPRRTLRNHIRTGTSTRKLGRDTTLTALQESEICERIMRLAEVGMPLTPKVLRRSVFSYVEEKK